MSNYGKYTYSFKAPFYNELLRINEQLTKLIGHDFNLVDIHDAPSIVTTPVVNDKTNGFQPVHKKDKSYGTITTFRSSVSDFKDNLLSNNAKSSKANKKFLKSNKDKSQTESKQSKRGGFISKLFSVFRKRKSPSKSQKRVVTKKDAGLARNISKDLPPISVPKKKENVLGQLSTTKTSLQTLVPTRTILISFPVQTPSKLSTLLKLAVRMRIMFLLLRITLSRNLFIRSINKQGKARSSTMIYSGT